MTRSRTTYVGGFRTPRVQTGWNHPPIDHFEGEAAPSGYGAQPMVAEYPTDATLGDRVRAFFSEAEHAVYKQTDHLFLILMAVQWPVAIALALLVSPRTWTGATSTIHVHVYAALILGAIFAVPPMLLAVLAPGKWYTRHAAAIGQVSFS